MAPLHNLFFNCNCRCWGRGLLGSVHMIICHSVTWTWLAHFSELWWAEPVWWNDRTQVWLMNHLCFIQPILSNIFRMLVSHNLGICCIIHKTHTPNCCVNLKTPKGLCESSLNVIFIFPTLGNQICKSWSQALTGQKRKKHFTFHLVNSGCSLHREFALTITL